MKISELLIVVSEAKSLDDDVVFETDKGIYIEQFDVNAEYNAETRVLILKEVKNEAS